MAESIEKKIRGATIIWRKPIKMVLPKRSRAAKNIVSNGRFGNIV